MVGGGQVLNSDARVEIMRFIVCVELVVSLEVDSGEDAEDGGD